MLEERLIGLDFETYGEVDLLNCGLENYVSGQYFRPLIARLVTTSGYGYREERIDFVSGNPSLDSVRNHLASVIGDRRIVAHNAPFEHRVLRWLGMDYDYERFIDSAVIARAAGAASKLEAAAPQLLGVDKMEEGRDLIKLFSIPGKYQEENECDAFDPRIVYEYLNEWGLFGQYCGVDARLSLRIALEWGWVLTPAEDSYTWATNRMNDAGWPVDLDMVKEMKRRYEANLAQALEDFQSKYHTDDLNLNSLKQMKEWCAVRGVRATSFDEKHVKSMLRRVNKKILDLNTPALKQQNYLEVRDLLITKQILGGSSLKKLDVILRNVSADGRLRNQYLHAGAGQTLRTSGRSVQMQNLKRLSIPADMEELLDGSVEWDNSQLAENLRQVFTSSHRNGRLIVGDFSSVESRGLAYQAGEEWKLAAYRDGKDLYKVLASQILGGLAYESVTKDQRQLGKVGELSCGYGAGPDAVREFAKNMGTELSEGESAKLVSDWRAVNPKIVEYWNELDSMLHRVVEGHTGSARLALPHDDLMLTISAVGTPDSLVKQAGKVTSIEINLSQKSNVVLRRYFHGCYVRGRSIGYFKPSDRKTGDLWRNSYIHPKTKVRTFYSVYGGKLSGILTQSLCREIFFQVLHRVGVWSTGHENVMPVGQFHDEIVLDWVPPVLPGNNGIRLVTAELMLTRLMSDPGRFASFPLAAEVKSAYRYIK